MDVLQGMFGNNTISRRVALTWSPKSPDLNTPDYYLLNSPDNLEDLKDNIKREIRAINPATIRSLMNNAFGRARSCIAVEEQHLRDIISRS